MNNNEPNKIINACFKEFNRLHKESFGESEKYDYAAQEILKGNLKKIVQVTGAVEVMSKKSIFKLVKMQCSLRFMPEHRFYRPFADAADSLFPVNS